MNDKAFNGLLILGLAAVIGIMSWRDMHPKNITTDASWAQNMVTYYAGKGIAPTMIPDNNKPVTIDLGTFSYAADGKPVWTPHSMPPTTFAQRQLNLQFDFATLPQKPAATIEKIKALADDWMHKGNGISVLILNYADAKVDAPAYAALINTLRINYRNLYVVYTGINSLWSSKVLWPLEANSAQFVIRLSDTKISPDLFAQLSAIKHNVVLQYPAGATAKDLDVPVLKKLPSLTGIELTLDPNKPLPKKEDTVGLFPKF